MDLNRDGHLDILAGSYSGFPQLIVGSAKGFAKEKSQPIMAVDGTEVFLETFMNSKIKPRKWEKTDRANGKGLCTSVSAVDWDADGDMDLLLGAYTEGFLYLRINEGSAKETRFASKNQPVLVNGKPLQIENGMASPCIVDFDQDGLFDLICGGASGGIYYCRNTGTKTAPLFNKLETLVEPWKENPRTWNRLVPFVNGQPAHPGVTLHIDALDYDHDGDIDLIVGAKSTWADPKRRKLTPEEQKTADALEKTATDYCKKIDDGTAKLTPLYKQMRQMKKDKQDGTEKYQALLAESEKLEDIESDLADLLEEVEEKLEPFEIDQVESGHFVWLFRRK